MKTIQQHARRILPLIALSMVAACGGGGGGGSTPVGGPTALDYGSPTASLTRGFAMASLTPTFTGTADTFAITTGALPLGISIDGSTGVISGTPTVVQASSLVTITASLTGGTSDTFDLSIAVDTPSSRALYVANETDGVIGIFSIDPASGTLNMRGDVAGLDSPLGMALTPNLGYLYAANSGAGTIHGFSVAPATGDLTELAGSPFPMIGGPALSPNALSISPDGGTLYAANRVGNSISLFAIGAGGALTEKAGSPFGTYATSRDLAATSIPSGDYLYLLAAGDANPLVTLSIATDGTLTEVDADTTGAGATAIATTVVGDFVFVANQTDATISSYAVALDGTLTEVAGSPFAIAGTATFLADLAVADDGSSMRYLYATATNGVASQFGINNITGALSLLTPSSVTVAGATMAGVSASPDGGTVYVSGSGNLREVDTFQVGVGGALALDANLPRVRTPGQTRTNLVLPSATMATWSTDQLYATNFSNDSISAFDVDGTGAMTAQLPLDTAVSTGPEDLVVSKSGATLYVTHPGDVPAPLMSVPILVDGTLDRANSTSVAGNNASFLTIDHNSEFLYVLDGPGSTLRPFPLNSTGLIGAPLASLGVQTVPLDVQLDPTGRFAYVVNFFEDTVSQFSVDLDTGLLTATTPATVAAGANPRALGMHPSGRYVYVTATGAAGAGGDLIDQYSVSPGTGALVSPTSITAQVDPGAIAITPNGRYAIVASLGDSSIASYEVTASGALNPTLIDMAATTSQPQTLAISADGSTVYVGINVGTGIEAFSIDATGMFTSLDAETTGGVIHSVALKESRQ